MRCLQILCHASGDDELPMFHGCLFFEWRAVSLLLGQAPKLQILAFESCTDYSYGESVPDNSWDESLDVPECLSSHLRTSCYIGFLGNKDEMQLVRQILKVARLKSVKNNK